MKVVLALGCFDPLHWGHLKYLQASKKLGDHLVVAVTSDRFVNKPNRPVFNEHQRSEMVYALKCVDDVAIVDTAEDAIRIIKPDIYTKGKEYEGRLPEQEQVESCGGQVVFIDTPKYSSTDLLSGRYLQVQSLDGGGSDPRRVCVRHPVGDVG